MRFTDPRGLAPIECAGLECTDSITVTDEYDPLFGSWAGYFGSDGSAFGMYSWNPVIPEPPPVLSDSQWCQDLIPEPRPSDADLSVNISEARAHLFNLPWLVARVRSTGEWDYKFRNSSHEDFGNFNFGVTFSAAGIPGYVSLVGAGVYQMISGTSRPEFVAPLGINLNPVTGMRLPYMHYPFGDDPADIAMIMRGIQFYRECVQ